MRNGEVGDDESAAKVSFVVFRPDELPVGAVRRNRNDTVRLLDGIASRGLYSRRGVPVRDLETVRESVFMSLLAMCLD